MVVADDEEREYGSADDAAEKKASYESMGIGVISMRDDFATIYGDGVEKTEIVQTVKASAAQEAPAVTESVPAAEETEETGSVQYVLYLGTNDKDTNKPVFTQAEALEKARSVLIRLFGGYTIQEAHGGWIGDDGMEYQEYTLVIYLSDTTEDQVHAAADELISLFNQSSVLIQANPTKTEFYSMD